MKQGKLAHLIYDFIQKGPPRSLREVFLEFEKSIEPDRATRCYIHTVRKIDRAKVHRKSLEHRIFHGKKRIVTKAIIDLVRRGVVEKSADSKKTWDRIYKSTGKPYITRGYNITTEPVIATEPVIEQQKLVADEKVASAKDTVFNLKIPVLPLPKEPEKKD